MSSSSSHAANVVLSAAAAVRTLNTTLPTTGKTAGAWAWVGTRGQTPCSQGGYYPQLYQGAV